MTTNTAYLTGHGRLAWPQARTLLDGCACTWSDLDGVQVADAPPAELPVGATHLWGWADDGRCVRLRFDHDAVYAAVLHTGSGAAGAAGRVGGEPVTATVRRATLWAPADQQAGPLPAPVLERTWDLLDVSGAAPVTFVRATNQPES